MEKKKLSVTVRNNLEKISIFLISFFYVFQGIFQITDRGQDIMSVLGNIMLSILIGVAISSNLTQMGLKDGRKSDKFIASDELYGQTKERATQYFDKLYAWCEYKNDQELNAKKRDIIRNAGLSWKAYRIGYYKDKELNPEQQKAIDEANACKIEKINNRILLSDLPQDELSILFGNKKEKRFGKSEREFKKQTLAVDLITRLFISFVLGYYTLAPLINGDNWKSVISQLLWHFMHILIWLTFGVLKYSNAKSFIEDEYRQTHLIQKTELLNEFIVTMQNSPQVVEQFDIDNDDIDNYINEIIKEKEQNDKKTILD